MILSIRRTVSVSCLAGFLLLPAAVPQALEKLAVRDLVAREPFRQSMADSLTDQMIADLGSSGRFEVIPRSEVQAVLGEMAQYREQDPRCESERCLEELGNSLKAGMVLSGSVGQSGSAYLVTLSMRLIGTGQKAARRTWQGDYPMVELGVNLAAYARELLGLEKAEQSESGWAAERRAKDETERKEREVREARERVEKQRRAAEEAARQLEELLRSLGIEMERIPGGEFEMGSHENTFEEPVHRVRVSDFSLGRTEVTQAQWNRIMGSNPSRFAGCDECPVEQVSWGEVQEFISKLNERTGRQFRLPTEAEWEYAAGGGSRHQKWAGTDSETAFGEYAWYEGNSEGKTHPVGQKRPNRFGLYDMSGNVWEWCSDWYGDYPAEFQENPTGVSSGTGRVDRGGAWDVDRWAARVADRFGLSPGYHGGNLGFRLALPSGP